MARAPRVAWDSTCFIAWVDRGNTESPEVLQALDVAMDRMQRGAVRIVASQAIELEVRPGSLERTQAFHNQLKACPFFESFAEGPAIRALARAIQERLQSSGRKGHYADLIHVATAIAARAVEFWTTDKKVLAWHTDGLITEVRICKPYAIQGLLDL